jgi:hypothetical protein
LNDRPSSDPAAITTAPSEVRTSDQEDPIRQTETYLAGLAQAAPKDDAAGRVDEVNAGSAGVSRDMAREAQSSTQAWLESILSMKE